MDDQANSISWQQRVERLEASLSNLQRTVDRLENEARQHQPQTATAPSQIFCPRCRGGNAPDATWCIWCGLQLAAPGPEQPVSNVPRYVPSGAQIPPPPMYMPTPGNAATGRESRVRQVPIPQTANAVAAGAPVPNGGVEGETHSDSFHFDFDMLTRSEFWINKVGIGLLLLGLAFFFKYSLDQGWLGAVLIPPVRIAFGLVLGSVLLVFGLRMHGKRRHYSLVLLGGSIASYYITGYASYELLQLAPYWLAFGFMVAVTLLAFALAIRENESILSLIGTIGALATPLVLTTGSREIGGLIAYTGLVLAGTSAVYLFRGWRSLFWTAFAGCWCVLALASQVIFRFDSVASLSDRWIFQAGLIIALLTFWAVPVIREILWTKAPTRWSFPTYPATLMQGSDSFVIAHVYLAVILTALLVASYTNLTWNITNEWRGLISMGAAAICGLVALGLRNVHRNLAYFHMVLALVFLNIGFTLVLFMQFGPLLMVTLALEAALLHFVARRVSDRGLSVLGHLVAVGASLLLMAQLPGFHRGDMPVFNTASLAKLATIALGLAASFVLTRKEEITVYRLLAHIAFLGWIWRELSVFDNGNGYVTVAWGVYALALLITGIRMNRNRFLMYAGIGTLFVVVAKLFLVDLVLVDTIWRILLFLGFGGLFLVLSSYMQNQMKSNHEVEKRATPEQ